MKLGQHRFAWQRPRSKAQPGFPANSIEQNCSDWLLLSTGPVLDKHEASRALCVRAVTAPVADRKWKRNVLLCLLDSSLWESHCWVHPFSLLMAPRFVDNFIRCFTKDKNQHNKTLKYLVLIILCGYSVNILMQNVSDQCLRTTRQCEIHVW